MRLFLASLLGFCAVSVHADDWQRLEGAAISAALTGRTVEYSNGATQRFSETGFTEYDHGEPSFGSWAVRGDRYCSVWPPSDVWACFDVDVAGERLRFMGDHEDVTEGVFIAQ
ncbi:hypothetical protein TRM7557_03469 [Tritonibacter multivorans]|uniref:Uncharacterized protein n=1 Tax=Tritonibacter multivorans TaxID=928856 RepID=A0A0P1H2G5_9RHOB|nr:hypothetical protein [Tritonibacter multivorans]MDA7420475.1 hypothetical protein [Tritonibacter multivorans]CUH81527.1 hypothetical protein TRM7557_03469 [Tritonibacter multivorans]SFC37435.1 hypothetical protein SAMN04488049_102306 [Tritonibacter multivorans]